MTDSSARSGGTPPAGRLQNVGDPRDLVEADDGVDLGDFPGEFRRIPLREAAGHHQPAAAARGLESGQVQNRLHPLFLGRPDEPAGVHDQGVGVRRFRGHLESPAGEDPRHHLAVEQVLRAAEAHEPHAGRFHGASR